MEDAGHAVARGHARALWIDVAPCYVVGQIGARESALKVDLNRLDAVISSIIQTISVDEENAPGDTGNRRLI